MGSHVPDSPEPRRGHACPEPRHDARPRPLREERTEEIWGSRVGRGAGFFRLSGGHTCSVMGRRVETLHDSVLDAPTFDSRATKKIIY